MEHIFDIKQDCLIVRPKGEIDHHSSYDIRNRIDRAVFKGGIKTLIFDFNNVSFMDSSGIGLLMGRYKLMQAVGGTVCVFGMSDRLKRLMEMSGMEKIIKFYKNEDEIWQGGKCENE